MVDFTEVEGPGMNQDPRLILPLAGKEMRGRTPAAVAAELHVEGTQDDQSIIALIYHLTRKRERWWTCKDPLLALAHFAV